MAGILERIRHACCGAHPRGNGGRVLDQTMGGQLLEPLGDELARLIGDAGSRIVERHIETAAREHDGPGASDKPRSDDCNPSIHSHSTFLLKSRSCFSKADAPVQVTEPRSSTTVRSYNASASSR